MVIAHVDVVFIFEIILVTGHNKNIKLLMEENRKTFIKGT